jgi:hypothetical protein
MHFNSWGFLVPPSQINANGPIIALYSTGICNDGAIYHLLVGICANGYPFSHIPTDK